MIKLTVNEFIEESNIIHNFKYDYSKVEYINTNTKVCIICPEHGEFWQIPKTHKKGIGCSKCSNRHNYTTEEWIDKAKNKYGDRFDYSQVDYRGAKTNIKIICKEHGEFVQTPDNHIRCKGNCCPKCAMIAISVNNTSNTLEFIEKANKKHNNLYNYDKVSYIKDDQKVIITCSTHGDFKQRPDNHLQGQGCPVCCLPKGELLIYNWLKDNNISFKQQFEMNIDRIARFTNKVVIDFIVKYDNHVYFIEYDGEQHFKFKKHFHKTEEGFQRQLQRDQALNDFCELHKDKVTLIRFKYTSKKEAIVNKLHKIFNIVNNRNN